jgi:recombination protein RecR
MKIPASLERLVAALARLPGIGEKTATRLAFYILREPEEYAATLAESVLGARTRIALCPQCHHITEEGLCTVCRDTTRDDSTVCVIEGIPDLLALEATGHYRGLYHVLHGSLAPLKGVGPEDLMLDTLVQRMGNGHLQEIIAATSVGVEGEATALYLKRLAQPFEVKVTRIAQGIPMGGDLEYMDQVTLARALEGRREL